MAHFPRTRIGQFEVSRLVIGSNWFLGFSHQSKAKDDFIKDRQDRRRIAEIVTVFAKAGVNITLGSRPDAPHFNQAIADAEQATGVRIIRIGTPHLELADTPDGYDKTARILDSYAEVGTDICMPHQCSTDALVDRRIRSIRQMDKYCAMIRQRGMTPGLSTHMPETPIYADETNLDVETYIQIYNAIGFLMQIEVSWVNRMIWRRRKPVLTIKPLAAGRLEPIVGLGFVWATIREQDLVAVGCLTPDEAHEVIETSLAILERRAVNLELQKSRSKASVEEASPAVAVAAR